MDYKPFVILFLYDQGEKSGAGAGAGVGGGV